MHLRKEYSPHILLVCNTRVVKDNPRQYLDIRVAIIVYIGSFDVLTNAEVLLLNGCIRKGYGQYDTSELFGK